MNLKCPECGGDKAIINDGTAKCLYCGAEYNISQPKQPEVINQNQVNPNIIVVQQATPVQDQAVQPKSRNKLTDDNLNRNKWLSIVALIGLVVFGILQYRTISMICSASILGSIIGIMGEMKRRRTNLAIDVYETMGSYLWGGLILAIIGFIGAVGSIPEPAKDYYGRIVDMSWGPIRIAIFVISTVLLGISTYLNFMATDKLTSSNKK